MLKVMVIDEQGNPLQIAVDKTNNEPIPAGHDLDIDVNGRREPRRVKSASPAWPTYDGAAIYFVQVVIVGAAGS